jgi:hypothetical protein
VTAVAVVVGEDRESGSVVDDDEEGEGWGSVPGKMLLYMLTMAKLCSRKISMYRFR